MSIRMKGTFRSVPLGPIHGETATPSRINPGSNQPRL